MGALVELLSSRREDLLRRFEREARARLADGAPLPPVLLDTLPRLLEELRAALEAERHGRPPPATSPLPGGARREPAARWIREYGLVRECLLALLEETGGTVDFRELRVLNLFLDQALAQGVVDLTEQRQEADAVARHAAELEAILQSIPDAVYVGDASGLKHANAPARELLGVGLEEVSPLELGLRLSCRAADTGRPLTPEEEPFARALAGQAVTREVVLRQPRTGRDVLVRCAAAPVRMGERIVGAVAVATDLSEHQRREEELRRTAEFRERFLGIVSHDLRNPLNAISLSASALLRDLELPARALKTAGRIAHSTERMGRMIGELLDFTRGRLGGGIPITRRPQDLRPLCRHVLDELRVARPERELRLRGEGHFHGEWDGDRLAQLVGNLVKNALDYSPDGTPVTVELHDEQTWVRMEVHNHGDAIPADVQPDLFEPFRRAVREEGSNASGLGLGLFIARQIAVAHGGRVEVRSAPGEGTTFTVRLPRGAPEA